MACCTDRSDKEVTRVVGDGAAGFCCTDILFTVLFCLNLIPVFYLFVQFQSDVTLSDHLDSSYSTLTKYELDDDLHVGLAAMGYAMLGSIALVFIWVLLCRFAATLLIVLAQLFFVASCVGLAIACVTSYEYMELTQQGAYVAALMLLLIAAAMLIWLFCIRKRIAFTALMLSSVAKVIFRTPELLIIQGILSLFVFAFTAFWAGSYIELLGKIEAYGFANDSEASFFFFLGNVWAILTLFWVQFTLLNVSLVTTCATVGAWYFSPDTFGRGCFCCRPPVWWGLLRSATCQFGSIALGSLLLAFMRTLIVLVQYGARKAEQSGGAVAKLACCCFICLLKCIERCLEWLTEYAFVYVAIYGTGFCTSGYRVFQLLSTSGAKALVQQTLLSPIEYLAGGLGLAAGMLMGYAAHQREGDHGLSEEAQALQLSVALLCGGSVGYLVMAMGTNVIDAGCKTLFVCFAEEPQALQNLAPELYASFSEAAPLRYVSKGKGGGKTAPTIAP